jgi:hypothetical protein
MCQEHQAWSISVKWHTNLIWYARYRSHENYPGRQEQDATSYKKIGRVFIDELVPGLDRGGCGGGCRRRWNGRDWWPGRVSGYVFIVTDPVGWEPESYTPPAAAQAGRAAYAAEGIWAWPNYAEGFRPIFWRFNFLGDFLFLPSFTGCVQFF